MTISSTPEGVSVALRPLCFDLNEDLRTLWHAIEETEHKSVAFDVYRHCVGDERVRRIVFLFVSWNFFKYTFLNTCSLLKTDGKLWSPGTWIGGINFLWGKSGILRKCLPDFMAYFREGFHPWQQDNRDLIEKNLNELELEQTAR